MSVTTNGVFAVVAPSGAGKTTLNDRLTKELPDQIEMSVSYTTRPKRIGEVDGDHYHFVTREEFIAFVEHDKMLEWAQVHGNFYGTPTIEIERISKLNKKTLLEIDVQGWTSAKKLIPRAKSIFIMPPTVEAMWERLESRGTDDLQVRLIRLESAKKEFEMAKTCDYFIINDDLESAYQELKAIIISGKSPKLDKESALLKTKELLDAISNAEWLKKLRRSFDSK